jgi:L-glyceraldehyde 3-phosphate reductase
VDEQRVAKARALTEIAQARGQSLAQMALAWVLRDPAVTSALIGASRVEQVDQNVATVSKLGFSGDELARIEGVLAA